MQMIKKVFEKCNSGGCYYLKESNAQTLLIGLVLKNNVAENCLERINHSIKKNNFWWVRVAMIN